MAPRTASLPTPHTFWWGEGRVRVAAGRRAGLERIVQHMHVGWQRVRHSKPSLPAGVLRRGLCTQDAVTTPPSMAPLPAGTFFPPGAARRVTTHRTVPRSADRFFLSPRLSFPSRRPARRMPDRHAAILVGDHAASSADLRFFWLDVSHAPENFEPLIRSSGSCVLAVDDMTAMSPRHYPFG